MEQSKTDLPSKEKIHTEKKLGIYTGLHDLKSKDSLGFLGPYFNYMNATESVLDGYMRSNQPSGSRENWLQLVICGQNYAIIQLPSNKSII